MGDEHENTTHDACTEEEVDAYCPRCDRDTPHIIHACRDQKTSRCSDCGHTERYLEH